MGFAGLAERTFGPEAHYTSNTVARQPLASLHVLLPSDPLLWK